jgi:tagatose 6-phosphate kinase
MILTAGLTPAWQQVMVFPSFRYGEVNRASEVHWLAQGKVLNAGIAVWHLGAPSLTLAPLGGPAFDEIDREFSTIGVPKRWIRTEAATRVCTTILDRATGRMTELVENGRALTPNELDDFLSAYSEEVAKASVAIIAGSLPTNTPCSFYRELAGRTRCPVVLDFRGDGLLAALEFKPLVVKPNREELGHTVGHPLDDDRQLLDAMRMLNHRGAQWVVVTHGAEPVWVSSATNVYRLIAPKVDQVVNPIGSGDSMAAGLAWAVHNGHNMLDAVKIGIAAAQDNLRRLDTGRLDPARVHQQAALVQVEEIR